MRAFSDVVLQITLTKDFWVISTDDRLASADISEEQYINQLRITLTLDESLYKHLHKRAVR